MNLTSGQFFLKVPASDSVLAVARNENHADAHADAHADGPADAHADSMPKIGKTTNRNRPQMVCPVRIGHKWFALCL